MSSRFGRPAGLALALTLALACPPAWAQADNLAEIRARAEAGDASAQNDLGGRLMATEDPAVLAEARDWFRRAMEAGDVEAKNNYATMLLMGLGGPSDEAEGRRLRDEAAAAGSIAANLSIAERYLRGVEGYPRDPVRAFGHVRSAAGSSSPMASYAQWRLAMMHLNGVGTPVDLEEAYRWVVRASDNGSVSAMISRGVMLATGQGVAEDDAAARLWYQRASESGDVNFAHALRALGGMLVLGEGGPVDVPRGIAYLRIAEAGGDSNATRGLEMFRDLITPEVDREARGIANRWMAEHMPAAED